MKELVFLSFLRAFSVDSLVTLIKFFNVLNLKNHKFSLRPVLTQSQKPKLSLFCINTKAKMTKMILRNDVALLALAGLISSSYSSTSRLFLSSSGFTKAS